MVVTGPSIRSVRGRTMKGKGKDRASAIEIPDDSPVEVEGVSDEEDEFEEVEIPGNGVGTPDLQSSVAGPSTVATPDGDGLDTSMMSLEEDGEVSDEEEEEQAITVEIGGETKEEREKRIALALRKKPLTAKDRALRLEVHKMHTVSLLAVARLRNRWLTNELLKARLLSLLPHPLQAAFVIPPKRFPDKAQRSRLFFDALQSLVTWWSQAFFDVTDTTSGMRTRTWDEVQEVIDKLPRLEKRDFQSGTFATSLTGRKGKGKGKKKDEDDDPIIDALSQEYGGERVRSVNSLMKKALQQEGSRDMSAQLFVSLARACGLGARLVVSLQPVPWRAEKVVNKKGKRGAGQGGRTVASRQGNGSTAATEDDDDDFEEVPIPSESSRTGGRKRRMFGAGKRRVDNPNDLYRLRAQRPAPKKLGTPKQKPKEDMTAQPPVYWAEIYSRADQRWIPVDPVAGIIRKKAHYEPASDSGPVRMIYVVGFEEDGYARDVTLRYAKNFGAKTAKLRPPGKAGERDWWSNIAAMLQRPIHLNRDDLEDAEFELSQSSEGMPMHMSGFKDHPIFVLERHLKREEVIQPKKECGRFRGEPVYRRANVLTCRTAENWIREGRVVKKDAKPLKWVKQRAVTLQKRRAMQAAIEEGFEPLQQGLYAAHQTEPYVPPPIENGIVPQNAYGNIDLYTANMLPAGAVHLPHKGIAKVAKKLGISFAEAVTGFEFKKQRAIPVLTGIVVAAENEAMVMEAYEETAAAAEERERQKREDAALKRWAQLINGLRVRLRLREEYGGAEKIKEDDRFNPMAIAPSTPTGPHAPRTAASILKLAGNDDASKWEERHGLSSSPELEEVKVEAETAETIQNDRREDAQTEYEPVAEADVEMPSQDRDTEPPRPTRRTRASAATSGTSTPRITLRIHSPAVKAQPAAKPKPRANGRTRGRKRKATESEEEAEESDDEAPAPKRRGRAAPPPPTEGVRRSLRSRDPKNEEQKRLEEEKRARLRQALASDEDDEDE